MKHYFLLGLIVLFGTDAFSQRDIRPSDPGILGREVFEHIQNRDYEGYLRLIFSGSDCDTMVNNAHVPDSTKSYVAGIIKIHADHLRSTSKANFEKVIEDAAQRGVDWQEVELTDVKFEIRTRDAVQSADVFLFCKFREQVFQIKLDDCHRSDAWLMLGYLEIKFKE
ncbi:MAG: hypothetical protein H6606_07020 [Flavobacteriales bacterium]|nr:hypothetical protein [Flavobacteriales bacterium]